ILIVLALGLIFTYISNNTVFGRQIYAIGGNAEAARLSGIDTRKRIFMLFVLMSVLVAIAAFVLTARLGGASPLTGGGMELDAIAAGFIGGASVSGGIGTIPGALIGGLVMASIDNGMSLMDLLPATQLMVKGFILLLAVLVDITTRSSRKRRS
ncbi:MAG: ABC transporter permease subunit, partial [Spirochaetia bacterium]